MNWSRCSSLVLAALLVVSATAGVVAAVETSAEGIPEEQQAGKEVTVTYTFTDLYTDYEAWTLEGQTRLTDVTWTVTRLDQAGNRIGQQSYDGRTFEEGVALENETARVTVRVTGTAPEIDNFSYDPQQDFLLASFDLVREGGASQDLTRDRVPTYTSQSKDAREAIASAESAVAGANSQQARNQLDRAIEAYNSGEFDLATDLATDAEQTAQQARQSRERTTLLLYGGIGVLALIVVFGGVYYWRRNQGPADPLS